MTESDSKLFVLIDCLDGKNASTVEGIRSISNVIEIKETTGPYNIIVTLQSQSNDDLKETLQKIRSIGTVRNTLTLRASHDLEVLG